MRSFLRRSLALALVVTHVPAFAKDECAAEAERGERVMSVYAEMLGIKEGAIYGHSLSLRSPSICLVGSPREKVKAIAEAFWSDDYRKAPIMMDDVPSQAEAIEFLERYFPCKP
jgi:hypothetical protein